MSVAYSQAQKVRYRVTLDLEVFADFDPHQMDWEKLFKLEPAEKCSAYVEDLSTPDRWWFSGSQSYSPPKCTYSMSTTETDKMTTTLEMTYNGYANYETWNVALWIQNDEYLYNTAKACVEFCSDNETPYDKFIRCMFNVDYFTTRDNVRWDSDAVDFEEINEVLNDLWVLSNTNSCRMSIN